jgi:hypothetical protein
VQPRNELTDLAAPLSKIDFVPIKAAEGASRVQEPCSAHPDFTLGAALQSRLRLGHHTGVRRHMGWAPSCARACLTVGGTHASVLRPPIAAWLQERASRPSTSATISRRTRATAPCCSTPLTTSRLPLRRRQLSKATVVWAGVAQRRRRRPRDRLYPSNHSRLEGEPRPFHKQTRLVWVRTWIEDASAVSPRLDARVQVQWLHAHVHVHEQAPGRFQFVAAVCAHLRHRT